MRRRIIWRYGDSPPVFGNLVAAVSGDGMMKVVTGFPVSAAEIAFSKLYNRYLIDQFGYGYDSYAFSPEVFVTSVDDDGFTLCYKNIPETLDVNYLAM
jgi:hypothetical protein